MFGSILLYIRTCPTISFDIVDGFFLASTLKSGKHAALLKAAAAPWHDEELEAKENETMAAEQDMKEKEDKATRACLLEAGLALLACHGG